VGTHPHVVVSERIGLRGRLKGWLRPQRHELERARQAADAELLRLAPTPPRLAWRGAELTAGARRLELAHELRDVVAAADSRYLPSASPIDRLRIRADRETLLSLADRLTELSLPVAARGVLLLERLLHDCNGPLYEGGSMAALSGALDEVAAALEGAA
jgi:hypothetical protein